MVFENGGNKMTVETNFGIYENCSLVTDKYTVDGALYIRIDCTEDDGFTEPLAIITKCLDDKTLTDTNKTYIDTNNCPWAVQFLASAGLLGAIIGEKQSGFCTYPLVEINMNVLDALS